MIPVGACVATIELSFALSIGEFLFVYMTYG